MFAKKQIRILIIIASYFPVLIIFGCTNNSHLLPTITTEAPVSSSVTSDVLPTVSRISTLPSEAPSHSIMTTITLDTPQTATPTKTITPTLAPTLDDMARKAEAFSMMQTNGDCDLPCFWGITPGKTDTVTAVQLFQQMGWKIADYVNIFGHVYEGGLDLLTLGDSVVAISLIDANGVVEKLSAAVGSNQFDKKANYFTLQNILTKFGEPDKIGLNLAVGLEIANPSETGYTLWLFYDSLGMRFQYPGTAVKYGSAYRICPSHPDDTSNFYPTEHGYVGILIHSPSSRDSLENVGFGGDGKNFIPIEKASDMSVSEFYQLAMEKIDQRFCFDTPREVWP